MSCSEVARHQPQATARPPALKLPSAGAEAAAAGPPGPCAFPRAPLSPSQQNKIVVYSKMQESLEVTLPNKQEDDEKDQPTEMEYLNSRCVLFTYFQGDIGSVVDEHFSRALNQASSFSPEAATSKSKTGLNSLWRENSTIASQRSGFPASFWTSSYQTPPPPCLSGAHHDFPVTAPGTFSTADPSSWPGHALHQTPPPPPPSMSESWHYPIASQARFLHPSVMQPRQILLLSPVLPQHGQEPFTEPSILSQHLVLTQASNIRTKVRRLHGSELPMFPVLRSLTLVKGISSFSTVAPNIEPLSLGRLYLHHEILKKRAREGRKARHFLLHIVHHLSLLQPFCKLTVFLLGCVLSVLMHSLGYQERHSLKL